jgi:hypothetical protein
LLLLKLFICLMIAIWLSSFRLFTFFNYLFIISLLFCNFWFWVFGGWFWCRFRCCFLKIFFFLRLCWLSSYRFTYVFLWFLFFFLWMCWLWFFNWWCYLFLWLWLCRLSLLFCSLWCLCLFWCLFLISWLRLLSRLCRLCLGFCCMCIRFFWFFHFLNWLWFWMGWNRFRLWLSRLFWLWLLFLRLLISFFWWFRGMLLNFNWSRGLLYYCTLA